MLGFFAGITSVAQDFGKMLERSSADHFWFMIIGMNLSSGRCTFSAAGSPRRMYVWTEARAGEGFFNSVSGTWSPRSARSCSASGSCSSHQRVGQPQAPPHRSTRGRPSLAWITPARPGANFDRTPTVSSLDEFFHRKYQARHR